MDQDARTLHDLGLSAGASRLAVMRGPLDERAPRR
jgi:hypothetical protein